MKPPNSNGLPVNLLAACFNNTNSTYKYYWFLSLLQEVEAGNFTISKRSLFSRMISNAWYIVNYFQVSFGKQDVIQDAIHVVNQVENIPIDENLNIVYKKLLASQNKITQNQLWHFNKNVPHWFLSPWFRGKKKAAIYNASIRFDNKCLYALHKEHIEINPEWRHYLATNSRILKDFCYWNLSLFLQARNPNVPDIPNKLIKPAKRSSLSNQRRNYWDLVLTELGSVDCIYTGNTLTVGNYAVEHFIPYSFVSHDLIWNLIPSDKCFNSTKSNKLPPIDKYFNPFFDLQKKAVEIVLVKSPGSKLLEEYLTILPDLRNFNKNKFRERIQPLITIAANNGFEFMR